MSVAWLALFVCLSCSGTLHGLLWWGSGSDAIEVSWCLASGVQSSAAKPIRNTGGAARGVELQDEVWGHGGSPRFWC